MSEARIEARRASSLRMVRRDRTDPMRGLTKDLGPQTLLRFEFSGAERYAMGRAGSREAYVGIPADSTWSSK